MELCKVMKEINFLMRFESILLILNINKAHKADLHITLLTLYIKIT